MFRAVLLVSLLAYVSASSKIDWNAVSDESNWTSVTCNEDASVAYATVYGSAVRVSHDSGITWKNVSGTAPSAENWTTLLTNDVGAYVVGFGDHLYYSKDTSGYWYPEDFMDNKTWTASSMTNTTLYDDGNRIAYYYMAHTEGLGFLGMSQYAVTYGQIFYNKPFNSVAASLSASGNETNYVVAAGAVGEGIWVNNIDGIRSSSFELKLPLNGSNFVAMSCGNDGKHLFASSTEHGNYVSSDYGESWQLTKSALVFNSVSSDSTGQHLLASIYNGGIYVSHDYGEEWEQTLAESSTWLTVSASGDFAHLFAVDGQFIYKAIEK